MLITSPAAIDEFLDVISRPIFRNVLDPNEANELGNLLQRARLFHPASVPAVCRDPSDDYLLALAVTAKADLLVTRDEDLLVLRRYGETEIIPVAEFLRRINE